mgnify:CR=1 FL=1
MSPEFNLEDIQRLKGLLTSARTVALVGHLAPDGDALGSTLGMAHVLRGKIDYLGMVRGKDDAFYRKCASRLDALLAKDGDEIRRVEAKAYEDARDREEKYLKTHFAEIKKTNTGNTVIKVVAFGLF